MESSYMSAVTVALCFGVGVSCCKRLEVSVGVDAEGPLAKTSTKDKEPLEQALAKRERIIPVSC